MFATRQGRSLSIVSDWLRKPMAVFDYNHGNYEAAFRKFLALAEHGNAEAQYYIGVMYSEGQGVPQDNAEAVAWYRRAAAQGDANARFIVGLQIPGQPESGTPTSDPAAAVEVSPQAPHADATGLENGIAGYRFRPAMRIETPIHVLEMHDRIVDIGGELGDYPVGPGAAPDGPLGHWQPVSEFHDDTEDAQPSDVGPVKPSAYLPFLKAFRQIVESDLAPDRQAVQICALSQTWPEFWEKLSLNYGGLDERWFIPRLCRLPGIGRNAAKALYAAGHLVADQVLALSDETLLAVRGIGKATVAKLRAAPVEVH